MTKPTNPLEADIKAYTSYSKEVAQILCTVRPEDTEKLAEYAREYVNTLDKLSRLEDAYADHVKGQL